MPTHVRVALLALIGALASFYGVLFFALKGVDYMWFTFNGLHPLIAVPGCTICLTLFVGCIYHFANAMGYVEEGEM